MQHTQRQNFIIQRLLYCVKLILNYFEKNTNIVLEQMKYQVEMKDIVMIETEKETIQGIGQLQFELELSQEWNGQTGIGHVTEATQMMTRPALGKAYM